MLDQVWQYFDQLSSVTVPGVVTPMQRQRCKFCGEIMRKHQVRMVQHLIHYCPACPHEIKEIFMQYFRQMPKEIES